MGMQGNLHDMAVADLIQHNCQERKTTRLTIRHQQEEAQLFFKEGNVVHASLGELQGEEVIYHILGWEEGTFIVEPELASPLTSIQRSWSGLLIEGAHRLDESQVEVEQSFSQPEVKPMSQLDDLLKQMGGEVSGFVAAAVVGMDGLNIAEYAKGKANTEAISAQMTLLFKLVDSTVTKLGAGVLEDDLLTTEGIYVLMRYLPGKQYYLGIAADRKSASLGNLRLMSKMYVDRLSKVMPR
jgi:predicted regulator of Ras-like GTPase activity (Roadblock/LC7/MglB family)